MWVYTGKSLDSYPIASLKIEEMLSASKLSSRSASFSQAARSPAIAVPRLVRASAKAKKQEARRDSAFIGNLRIAVVVVAVAAGDDDELGAALLGENNLHGCRN